MSTHASTSEFLDLVARRYASAQTYRDRGECTNVIVSGVKPWQRTTRRTRFRTIMKRPDRWLLEYHEIVVGPPEEGAWGILWRGADGVHSWSTIRDEIVRHDETPNMAHALIPVHMNVLHLIVMGLLEIPNPSPWWPAEKDVISSEVVGESGRPVRVLKFTHKRFVPRVWVDEASHLLVRAELTSDYSPSDHESTVKHLRERVDKSSPDEINLRHALAHMEKRGFQPHQSKHMIEWDSELDVDIGPVEFEFVPPC